jgi:hypothetical protein
MDAKQILAVQSNGAIDRIRGVVRYLPNRELEQRGPMAGRRKRKVWGYGGRPGSSLVPSLRKLSCTNALALDSFTEREGPRKWRDHPSPRS